MAQMVATRGKTIILILSEAERLLLLNAVDEHLTGLQDNHENAKANRLGRIGMLLSRIAS